MAMKLVDADKLNADLTSIADKIRAKTGGEDALSFPRGFESALDTIESADSALAEVEYALSNGYTIYNSYFNGKTYITSLPYGIIRHINQGEEMKNFCQGCISLSQVGDLDAANMKDMQFAFYNLPNLTSVGMINSPLNESFYYSFYGCTNLHTIKGINLTSATNTNAMLGKCTALANIVFYGDIKVSVFDLSPCTALTHDSLMSVINALYDWASEGSTNTYKLALGSTNLAKLTDVEKAIATQKGWTLT